MHNASRHVPISGPLVDGVWRLYRSHPVVGACVQLIRNSTIGAGLEFEDASTSLEQVRHYEAAAHGALDWLTCVGVVPLVLRPASDGKGLLPVVPEPESVVISVGLDECGEVRFTAQMRNGHDLLLVGARGGDGDDRKPPGRVVVWARTSYRPTAQGQIVTPITRIVASEQLLATLRENVLVASTIRANPPIVSRSVQARNADNDGVVWNVDDDTIREAERQRLDRVAANTRDEFELHRARWDDGGGVPTTAEGLGELGARCRPREYYLAADRDLVRPPDSAAPSQFAELAQQCDEKICLVFGVPIGMFGNRGGNVQTSYLQSSTFGATVLRTKHVLEQFLCETWQLCRVARTETELEARVESQVSPSPTEADRPRAAKRTRVDTGHAAKPRPVTVMSSSLMPMDQVRQSADYGYLSTAEAANITRAMCGLAAITEEEVRKQVDERMRSLPCRATPKKGEDDSGGGGSDDDGNGLVAPRRPQETDLPNKRAGAGRGDWPPDIKGARR